MSAEFHRRQQAIRLRLAGRSVTFICEQVARSRRWFYYWWQRYQDTFPDVATVPVIDAAGLPQADAFEYRVSVEP